MKPFEIIRVLNEIAYSLYEAVRKLSIVALGRKPASFEKLPSLKFSDSLLRNNLKNI